MWSLSGGLGAGGLTEVLRPDTSGRPCLMLPVNFSQGAFIGALWAGGSIAPTPRTGYRRYIRRLRPTSPDCESISYGYRQRPAAIRVAVNSRGHRTPGKLGARSTKQGRRSRVYPALAPPTHPPRPRNLTTRSAALSPGSVRLSVVGSRIFSPPKRMACASFLNAYPRFIRICARLFSRIGTWSCYGPRYQAGAVVLGEGSCLWATPEAGVSDRPTSSTGMRMAPSVRHVRRWLSGGGSR